MDVGVKAGITIDGALRLADGDVGMAAEPEEGSWEDSCAESAGWSDVRVVPPCPAGRLTTTGRFVKHASNRIIKEYFFVVVGEWRCCKSPSSTNREMMVKSQRNIKSRTQTGGSTEKPRRMAIESKQMKMREVSTREKAC